VVKTQGRRGEVAVELHTGIPDRFTPGFKLLALGKDDRRVDLQIEDVWPHKGSLVLKFAGIDSISQAELLVGCELQVARSERAQLEPGWIYVSDLIGCKVFDGSREIGEVRDVRFGAGEAPLLEVQSGGQTHEVPYAEAYLLKVDLAAKRIEMQLPEGMLDLSAPLTAEEKQEQRQK
jgi:16S rRNA processing protein RimM